MKEGKIFNESRERLHKLALKCMTSQKSKEKWKIQFLEWLKEICPWEKTSDYCEFIDNHPAYQEDLNSGKIIIVQVYTHEYKYWIVAKKDYLGCQVSTRKPRAGETWTRGNDLTDGKFCRKTWENIKNDIIRYELVRLAKKARGIPDSVNEKK